MKTLAILLAASAIASADVVTYQSEADWLGATEATATSYFVENFNNNQISTPGLSASVCSWDCMYPIGLDQIQNNTYYAADGKHAYQPLTGQWANYVTTLFTMPANIEGVGFELSVPQSANQSPFALVINTTEGSQFWQWGDMSEIRSPEFPKGFLGFVDASADITSVDFLGGSAEISQIIGADPAVSAATTPEPGTWGLLGASLLGLGVWRRKKAQ